MFSILQSMDSVLEEYVPYISIIIPVRCEFEGLSLLLPDLMSQDYPRNRLEILVADGKSTDATPELVKQFAKTAVIPIILLQNDGIRSSSGRNVGIAAAKGDIIIFIDGHCRVHSKTLLSDTVKIFQETNSDCLCRPQPLYSSTICAMSRCIAETRRSIFGHGRGSMIYNLQYTGVADPRSSGASYLRSVFETVGLYDETFDACEDVELNTRVAFSGMQCYSHPKLAIEYQARSTLASLAKQMIRYGRGRIRLVRKHRGECSLSSIAPLLLCLFLVAPLIFLQNSYLFIIATIPIILYMIVVFASTMQLLIQARDVQLAWAFAVYPVIHLGLGFGMIVEVIAISRRCCFEMLNRNGL